MTLSKDGQAALWVESHVTLVALLIVAAGLAARIYYAAGAYLNPDEAQHFIAANTGDFYDTYLRSRYTAHPPLLLLVVNAVLRLGNAEVVIRLPSLLAEAGALWLAFRWLQRCAGDAVALAGLIFLTCAPGMISAATEVRQYGVLLLGICGALYAMERFTTELDTRWVAAFALSLYIAILSHYSAAWVVLTLGIYVASRLWLEGAPRSVTLAWVLSQAGALAIYAWLCLTHLGVVRGGSMENIAMTGWLKRSYYQPGEQNLAEFLVSAVGGAFRHLMGGPVPGLAAGILFVAGLFIIAMQWPRSHPPPRRDYAVLLILPLLIGCGGAVDRLLPFGGTRHVSYLLPFIAAGVAVAVTQLLAARTVLVTITGVVVGVAWLASTSPANNVTKMDRADLAAALAYLEQAVPPKAIVFVDGKTHLMLLYYLRREEKGLRVQRTGTLNETLLQGHRVVSFPQSWSFDQDGFPQAVTAAIATLGLERGQPLWIMSIAWLQDEHLESELGPQAVQVSRRFGGISVLQTAAGFLGNGEPARRGSRASLER
jgi:hypothetical protein